MADALDGRILFNAMGSSGSHPETHPARTLHCGVEKTHSRRPHCLRPPPEPQEAAIDLATRCQRIEPRACPSPWAGHEHSRGYAVMVLPFSSGHLLGLRVFPETDFGPYTSVWHRPPGGGWSIYNDGPSLETTCPRWWGPCLEQAALTEIEVTWTGPRELRVEMDDPPLVWTMTMSAPPLLRLMNAMSDALPLWTWRPAPLLRLREWMAQRFVGMGQLRFAFVTPAGQEATIMPERIFGIPASQARLDGTDLGRPTRLDSNPTIGGVPLPTRATFVIGQAHGRIVDPEEHRRTREAVGAAGGGG